MAEHSATYGRIGKMLPFEAAHQNAKWAHENFSAKLDQLERDSAFARVQTIGGILGACLRITFFAGGAVWFWGQILGG